jgi:replicative DNA helicase
VVSTVADASDGRDTSGHLSARAIERELIRVKALNAVGGVAYLVECTDADEFDGMPPTSHGATIAGRRVASLAQRRRVIDAARAVMSLAQCDEDPAATIDVALQRFEGIAREGNRAASGRQFSEALTALLCRDPGSTPPAWSLPWPTLSAAIGGLRRKRLVVVAARPGVGKSAIAFNLALSLAAPQVWNARSQAAPVPVLFFTLEMGDEELACRGAGSIARVCASDIEGGSLRGDVGDYNSDFSQVVRVARDTNTAVLMIDDHTTQVARMRSIAGEFFRKHGPGVMFVDYLQLCSAKGLDVERNATRERNVAEMSRAFKLMAKDLDINVVLLSQLNRDKDEHEQPTLRDLRESGSLEQDADAVLFLYGPKPDAQSLTRTIKAYLAKVRGGAAGTEVDLIYVRRHTRFDEDPDAFRALPTDDHRDNVVSLDDWRDEVAG